MEYYDFCDQENIGIYWCELNNPIELDIRRQSNALRTLALNEINQVLTKYQGRIDLNVDVLEKYRETLMDNSYLLKKDFVPDVLTWHQNIETTLKKTTRFVDLWPDLAKELHET